MYMTQIFKTTLLMAGLTGLFMLVGYLFGGQTGMLMALRFCVSYKHRYVLVRRFTRAEDAKCAAAR